MRKLNSVVIPIVYSEKFYKDILDPSLDDINKLSEYCPFGFEAGSTARLLADIQSTMPIYPLAASIAALTI